MAFPEAFHEGVRLFNEGRYFEAHEAWEDCWGLGPPAARDLTMGLIKVAVALHHLANGNARGFDRQLDMGLPALRRGVAAWPEAEPFMEAVESLHAQVRFHGAELPGGFEAPRLPLP